jgi:hypothetical protein
MLQALSETVSLKTYRPTSISQAMADLRDGISAISVVAEASPVYQGRDGFSASFAAGDEYDANVGGSSTSRSISQSRVVTLILPHDVSWDSAAPHQLQWPPSSSSNGTSSLDRPSASGAVSHDALKKFMSDCAAAMRSAGPRCAIFLGGDALLVEGIVAISSVG